MKVDVDLSEIDELLREWAYFFRDRRRLESCRSIEHRFKAHSDDFASEGWGDVEAPPPEKKRIYILARAIQTHEALMQLPKMQKWALTYAYCYPTLPRGLVLRVMRKWVGKSVSWKVYLEQVEVGRFRVYACLKTS